MRDNQFAGIVRADIRDVDEVLNDPETRGLLDFDRPVGLLLIAVLPFIPEDPAPLLARYREPLARGSYQAVTHLALDGAPEEFVKQLRGLIDTYDSAGQGLTVRDRPEIASWFDGLDLVPPGVVPVPDWRPDGTGGPFAGFTDDPARFGGYGAVGRLR